jgi:hypothetical protein
MISKGNRKRHIRPLDDGDGKGHIQGPNLRLLTGTGHESQESSAEAILERRQLVNTTFVQARLLAASGAQWAEATTEEEIAEEAGMIIDETLTVYQGVINLTYFDVLEYALECLGVDAEITEPHQPAIEILNQAYTMALWHVPDAETMDFQTLMHGIVTVLTEPDTANQSA